MSVPALDAGGAIGRVMDNGDRTFTYDSNDRFEHLIRGESTADAFNETIRDNHGGQARPR